MAILILVGRHDSERHSMQWFSQAWKQALLDLDPALDIRIWPDAGNHSEIELILVWNHPPGLLKQFHHAKAIYSLAAGVDHIFVDPDIDSRLPIVRIVDSYMANDIVQYVAAYVLQYIKRVQHWADKQKNSVWYKQPPFTFADKAIGIMGLGHLGGKAASILQQMGLTVNGWSQSPKQLPGVNQFAGDAQFHEFLSHTDILICMLPLTAKTENILNRNTFSYLRNGAYLINVGRGQHLVEEDLLSALSSGQLSGACLDVFRQEPLPQNHPFWSHPDIRVTPHIASVTNPVTAAPQLYENYRRLMAGLPLFNRVDLQKGY
ncbi:2-hydroxyacid dehydrogenase [Aquicella siphonis]|nr:glyoxylate/hydroxypyruvate reductase A [Aquicella siphonis]